MVKKIWVVEDDKDIADIIKIILSDEGLEIRMFNDARSIKDVMKIIDADLLITDVMLPDGNGFDICLELQRNYSFKKPILVMSANKSISDIPVECQIADFIAKPFGLDDFVLKVKSLI